MSRSLSLSWNDIRFGGLQEICDAVEHALEEAGVDFYYLIGAQARDIWHAAAGKESRRTMDVDFAILVANGEQFNAVKEVLKSKHGYEELRRNTFKMSHPNGTHIDILPFGDIAEDDTVIASGQGLTRIKVNGFKEVAEAGIATAEIENAQYRLATLPAIALLKFIAYDDGPERRPNDPGDIVNIFKHLFDLDEQLFFEKHFDVLDDIDHGYHYIGARVAGREMKPILDLNAGLFHRISDFLQRHLKQGKDSAFIQAMAAHLYSNITVAISTLEQLQRGLNEEAPAS